MKVNFREMFSTFSKNVNEHKPEIATGAGLLFMLGGTAVAVVATVKTMKALEKEKDEKLQEICPDGNFDELTAEEKQEYDDTLMARPSVKEVVRLGWKWWILPAGLLAAGTGSILYSDKEQAKRIAGLMAKASALAFQVAESKDYREAAREILGEEKEKEIDDKAANKSAKRREIPVNYSSVRRFGSGTLLCMEYYSNQLFYADDNYLNGCLNTLNERINDARSSGTEFVELNDWFDILGIDRAGCGSDLYFDTAAGNVRLSDSDANAFRRDDGELCWTVRLYNPPRYRQFY